jgi:ribosome-associated toxin RatA of RatAB toxin-antitoxin module
MHRLDSHDDLATSPFDMLDADEVVITTDLDDLPTVDDVVDFASPDQGGERSRRSSDLASGQALAATLPVAASAAYEAFCDAEEIPRWLSVVQSARVLSRTPAGRPLRVAFVGRLQHACIGYALHYRHDDAQRVVSWGTAPGSLTLIAGRAQFIPLGERATLMQYQLAIDLAEGALPPWIDPFFSGHATSVVMNDFREYVLRVHRRTA